MPVKNYDNTLVGRYIRALENPDSIGFQNGRWYQSPRKVDDSRNRGFGVDVINNDSAAAVSRGRKGQWLTEQEERSLRNNHINYAEGALDRNMKGANASEAKRAMAVGMIYRGDANALYHDKALKNAYYNGSDEDFQNAVSNFYNAKGTVHYLPERAKSHSQFMQGQTSKFKATYKLPPIVEQPDATRVARRYDDGGSLDTPRKWDDLSLNEMSDIMAVAVRHGITSLQDIKAKWNEFAEGGYMPDTVGEYADAIYQNAVEEPYGDPSPHYNNIRIMPWDSKVLNQHAYGGHIYKRGGKVSQRNQRAGYAVDYFVNKGLSREQAAGLVGNLMRESSMNTEAVNPASGAYGLGQWLGERKTRLFRKYGNHPTFYNQLDYIWDELNSTHKKGLKMLKSSKTVDDAARNAFGYYEFSAGPEAAVAAMNRNGMKTKWKNPNGTVALNDGINNAWVAYGKASTKPKLGLSVNTPTIGYQRTLPQFNFEGIGDEIADIGYNQPSSFNVNDALAQGLIPSNPTDYGTPVDYSPLVRTTPQEDTNEVFKDDKGMGLLTLMRNMGVLDEPEQQPLVTYTPQRKNTSPFVVKAPVYNDTLLDDSWFAKGGALYGEGGDKQNVYDKLVVLEGGESYPARMMNISGQELPVFLADDNRMYAVGEDKTPFEIWSQYSLPEVTVRPSKKKDLMTGDYFNEDATRYYDTAFHPEDTGKIFGTMIAPVETGISYLLANDDTRKAMEEKDQGLGAAGNSAFIFNPFSFTQNVLDNDVKSAALEGSKIFLPMDNAAGHTAALGLGAYGLFNENGLPKTWNYLQNGDYGKAALSGAGDAFNALMTRYGFRGLKNGVGQNVIDYFNLKNFINRYGYNYKPRLGLIFDDVKLDRLTNQLVKQHNSFARGVDVTEARKYWGFPDSMSDAEIAEYTLTHSHRPTQNNAGGNPERKPVLYTSNSIDLGKAYTNGYGYVGIVQRPIRQGNTRSETLSLNDFRFYRNPKHAFSGTTDEPFILRKGEGAPAHPRNKGTYARRVKGKVRQMFKPVAPTGIDALAHQGSEIVSVRRPDDVNFRHYLFLGDEGEPILNLDYMFRYDKNLPSVDYSTHSVGLSKKKELGGMLQ